MGNMQAHHVLSAMQTHDVSSAVELDMFQFVGTADKGLSEAASCN
jgi:hypothetical protein